MNRISLIIYLIVAIAINGNNACLAQDLIAPQIMQNGQAFGYDHIFTSPDPIEFSLNNPDIKGEWKVEILYDDGYDVADFQATEEGRCIFSPNEASWTWAERQFDQTLQRDIYEVRISFTSAKYIVEWKSVKFALLPSTPIISDVIFTFEYDWELDIIWPYGKFEFNIQSDDATGYGIRISDSFLFSEPKFFPYNRGWFENSKGWYDADWGEYMCVYAKNRFGLSHYSEVLCTTDYITDENVLNRINELRHLASIDDINVDDSIPDAVWNDNTISFNLPIDHVEIYDLSGRQIINAANIFSLDLSQLNRGMYLVTYTRNNHISTLKILKQ